MQISGKTHLFGLLGWPVSHSKSPAMHNAAAQQLGLDLAYVPLPVHPDDLETAVKGLPALGFRGVNITVPHKQAVMPLLDEIDEAAAAIGAVNTIVFEKKGEHQRAIGYNTDWSGFLADLESLRIDPSGRGCLVIGAGGSARAVAYALASVGGRVHLFARRIEQAEEVVCAVGPCFPQAHVNYHHLEEVAQLAPQWQAPLIVNTTPLGMTPNVEASPWPEDRPFPTAAVTYDLVYTPAETKFMRQARAAGHRAENGLGMLLWQGAKAFELWTGVEPDVEVMRQGLGIGR